MTETSKETVIYHNPRCSKSRETLALLQEKGITPRVVEYLFSAPTETELRTIVAQLGVRPAGIVRTKEEIVRQSDIDLDNDDAVFAFLAANPQAIERPIVVHNGKAKVGRPPEAILTLF